MRIFKTKRFDKWVARERITNAVLVTAVNEISKGLVEASLGAHVFKKRIRLPGRGKRGGARMIVAYCAQSKTFFMYGYTKNERENIYEPELDALKELAAELLELKEADLARALEQGELKEINNG
jgi:hypothetical protein